MAKDLKKMGFDGIDLNMGCPVKTATKHASGSALILNPELAGEMIKAAKKGGLPVSVKTRLGYSKVDEWEEGLGFLLKQNIVALTVHARTKKEMSKVPAHHELIPEIKQLRDEIAPQTLLLINGDIETRTHGQALIDAHSVDGVMIGRGIFHNPFAFEKNAREHTRAELIGLLNQHLDLYDTYHELTGRPYDTLKRFFKIYVRDFDGAAETRDKLMHTKTTEEAREVLSNLS